MAQYPANKIVSLGGGPTTQVRPVPVAATNREMVEQILEAEQQAAKDYTERAKQAEDLGDSVKLKNPKLVSTPTFGSARNQRGSESQTAEGPVLQHSGDRDPSW